MDFAGTLEAFSEGVVSSIRWLIGAMRENLVPFARDAGALLSVVLFLVLPGGATYGVARLVARGTERAFGRLDALLTMLAVAGCLGWVLGTIAASAYGQGRDAIGVACTVALSVGAGLGFGCRPVLGSQSALFVVSVLATVALLSGAYMVLP